MIKKALIIVALLSVSVILAYYVYPTHPVLVWVLLGFCWVCFRLGLRAQRLFRAQNESKDSSDPSSISPSTL